MSVLDRESLEQSPLADLHAIASELTIDSYRLLRREALVEAILARQEGREEDGSTLLSSEAEGTAAPASQSEPKPRRRRSRRSEPSGAQKEAQKEAPERPAEAEVSPPAAPKQQSDRARFEALPAGFPDQRFEFDSDEPTVAAIAALAPIGRGSRVVITGAPRTGKTEALRRLAAALDAQGGAELLLLLVGVRPEEIGEWQAGKPEPVQALSFGAPTSALDRAVYAVIDQARATAVEGGHAVVLIDTLDALHEHAARRALATARNIIGGGSVTVIATASEPAGAETTVIALDPDRAYAGRFPALEPRLSGTMRAELLVGEEGMSAISAARQEAAGT